MYHINPETNKVGFCKAAPGNCAFGNTNHFIFKDEANSAAEKKLAAEFGKQKTLTKITSAKGKELSLDNVAVLNDVVSSYNAGYNNGDDIKPIRGYKSSAALEKSFYRAMLSNNETLRFLALLDITNNPNVSTDTLLKIDTQDISIVKQVLQLTNNKDFLNMGVTHTHASVRSAALSNPHIDKTTIKNTIAKYPENYYKFSILKKIGYTVKDIEAFTLSDVIDKNAKATQVVNSLINKPVIKNSDTDKEKIEKITKKFVDQNFGYKYHLYAVESVYKNKREKYLAAFENYDWQSARNRLQEKSQNITEKDVANVALSKSEAKIDFSTYDKFKNAKTNATYEDSMELQTRWEKGINDLPSEYQSEIYDRQFSNTQDGLRAVVDLFRTTDTDGQKVQNGLNNFVNHIDKMKERDEKKGFIEVIEPKFLSPIGNITVERRRGDPSSIQIITFRINMDKFEMRRSHQSRGNWDSFYKVDATTSTELVAGEANEKKSFWDKIKDTFW